MRVQAGDCMWCGGGSHWRAGHDVTMSRVTGYDGPTLTLPTAALISLTPAAVSTLQTVPSAFIISHGEYSMVKTWTGKGQ